MTHSIINTVWRNLMVSGFNEGLRLGIFGLTPGEQSWVYTHGGGDDQHPAWAFEIAGLPARAEVSTDNWDELHLLVEVNPTPMGLKWNKGATPAGWVCGGREESYKFADARAFGWMERRNGPHLQTGKPGQRHMVHCKTTLRATLAGVQVDPVGYRDEGRFYC